MTATSADPPEDENDSRPMRAALIVWLALLILTAASAWAADRADDNTEARLLEVQSRQAAAALSTTVLLIQQPLATVLSVQGAAGAEGDPRSFRQQLESAVGPGRLLASASLWRRDSEGGLTRVGAVGASPLMRPGSAEATALLRSSFAAETFVPRLVGDGERISMAFALADRTTDLVVYAERLIPENRRSPVDRDAAFADLRYAIYLGPVVEDAALTTTNVPPAALPLDGETYRTSIPFGSSELTFVTSPRRHLGAALSHQLPVMLLLGGLLLTAIASISAFQLVQARQRAERGRVKQRDISERLQRAVLPHLDPTIPRLDIASEYLAGTKGVDIGGDWYSIIGLDDDTFGFVVGDVSGHGVDAVAVMAHARFTLRAYLIDGKSPDQALEICSRQFDISVDGHMTTAVVGVGNWRTGEVTLANAGHPAPLHITADGAEFVSIPTGPPLGTGRTSYRSTTIQLAPGDALLAYTDGLIERRGEQIDAGMERLRMAVLAHPQGSVDDLVQRALSDLHHDDAADDIAVLAFRRHQQVEALDPRTGEGPMVRRAWPAGPQAPAAARAFVTEALRPTLVEGSAPALDEVILVTSELVTNAVRADAREVTVDVVVGQGRIDLVVSDDAAGWPAVRHVGSDALGGRGLAIVEQLAESWSTRPEGTGKAVTASWLVDLPGD